MPVVSFTIKTFTASDAMGRTFTGYRRIASGSFRRVAYSAELPANAVGGSVHGAWGLYLAATLCSDAGPPCAHALGLFVRADIAAGSCGRNGNTSRASVDRGVSLNGTTTGIATSIGTQACATTSTKSGAGRDSHAGVCTQDAVEP